MSSVLTSKDITDQVSQQTEFFKAGTRRCSDRPALLDYNVHTSRFLVRWAAGRAHVYVSQKRVIYWVLYGIVQDATEQRRLDNGITVARQTSNKLSATTADSEISKRQRRSPSSATTSRARRPAALAEKSHLALAAASETVGRSVTSSEDDSTVLRRPCRSAGGG